MLRQLCILILFSYATPSAALAAAVPVPNAGHLHWEVDAIAQPEPEIDQSPIWAMVFGRYLYHLGREMFWPDLDQRDSFTIGVVGWDALAEDLGQRLDGRSIAGLPVQIIALTPSLLRDTKGDFTMLFLGDTNAPSKQSAISDALKRWDRKQEKEALIITDGGKIPACDLVFKRKGEGQDIGLCLVQQLENLDEKGMVLPAQFLQRLCP